MMLSCSADGNNCLLTGCLVIATEICQEFGMGTKIYVSICKYAERKLGNSQGRSF